MGIIRVTYTSESVGNLTDFGYKCHNCNTITKITLKVGELKKQELISICYTVQLVTKRY